MTAPYVDPLAPTRPSGLSVGYLLTAFVRRWPWVLFTLLIAGGIAFGIMKLAPLPTMTAQAIVRIQVQQQAILTANVDQRGDFQNYRQEQAMILKSRMFLNEVIKAPEVQAGPLLQRPDPIGFLEKGLSTDFRLGTEYMRVSLVGDDEAELRPALVAIMKTFLSDSERRDKSRRTTRLQQLDREIQSTDEKMVELTNRAKRLADNLTSGDPSAIPVYRTMAQSELNAAQQGLQRADADLVATTQELEDSKARWGEAVKGELPENLIEQAIQQHPGVQKLEQSISRLQADLAELKRVLNEGASNPRVGERERELAEARKELVRLTDAVRPTIERQARDSAIREEKAASARLTRRIASLEGLKKLQSQTLDAAAKRLVALSGNVVSDVGGIRAEVAQTEGLLGNLRGERDRLNIEMNAPSRLAVHAETEILTGLEGNRRLKIAVMAAVGVVVLGIVTLLGWDWHYRRVSGVREVTDSLGLKVVGTLPPIPKRIPRSAGKSRTADWQLALMESIDTTRTILLHGLSIANVRTLLVTSPMPSEAKTSLSSQLAVSLARAGHRTLLVDGDLRHPSAHRLFEVGAVPGLAEVLRRETSADEAILPTRLPNLSILPAGWWTPDTTQALSGDGWRTLKDDLQSRYDYVIVDSAPVLPVVDTLLLARCVDGVIISVLKNVSRIASLKDAIHRLTMIRATVIGAVISGVETSGYYRTRYPAPAEALEVNDVMTASLVDGR